MIIILSGDIELNPGAVDRNQIKKEDFEVYNNKGLHFMYLNINGLLNEIDELRCNWNNRNQIRNTIYDSEVTVDGSSK